MLFAEHREAISRGSGSVLFPVACLHYPRTALKTVGEWKRQISRGASRRSRHVKRARDRTRETIRCRETKHLTDRHSRRDRHRHGCKMLRAIHSRPPSPSAPPLALPAEIRSSPSLRERGRSTLVKIPNDSWRPEGSSLKRAGVCDDPHSWKSFPSANYFRDYFCMSGYHSVLIRLRRLRPFEIEIEFNANIKQLFASKLQNFSYNYYEKNLFREANAIYIN